MNALMNTMHRHEDDENENKKERKIARDGEFVRMPLLLMDGEYRAYVERGNEIIRDAMTHDRFLLHEAGFVTLTDAEVAANEKMYADRDAKLTSAWKSPPAVLPTQDAAVRVHRTSDFVALGQQTTTTDAYRKYEQRLSNAWKGDAA